MTLVVTHAFINGVADDPSAAAAGEVVPSEWNANHTLTGQCDATQLNSNVVQSVVNDTNIQGTVLNQVLTFSWGGTLAAARLNANVVQAITNDTNITGSISAQTLTLGWTGTLAAGRLNSNVVQGVTNDTNITGSILAQNLTLGWTGTLAAARLNSNVVQSVVNDTNVTGSISAQVLTLGWTGTLANARLATMAAYTFKGNPTGSTAAPTDFTIDGLTLKASPASTDELIIWDVAGAAIKKATISGAVGSTGVSSIAGNTGAFTLSHGLTNSTNDIQIDLATHRGYLCGLTLSTAGSSATFSVAAGVSVDDTQSDFMKLTSAISKTTSAWAVGTGNGALDTGAIATSTWYHVYEIKRTDTGVVDILISLSASSPTMPTSYTLKRRIGSMKTNGSSQWTKFIQLGDEFLWDVVPNDANGSNPGTAGTLYTLTVPTGVQVWAVCAFIWFNVSGTTYVQISSPDITAPTGGSIAANVGATLYSVDSTHPSSTQTTTRTNTSAQIRATGSGSSGSFYINTVGWLDRRGRDA